MSTKILESHKIALIVVDKQRGYFDSELVSLRGKKLDHNAEEVLRNIDNFIQKMRELGVEVIWTQMVEDSEDSPWTISHKMRNEHNNILTITKKGNGSFEFFGRVVPNKDEKIIEKYRYDAFAQTELADYLRSKDVSSVILVGGYAARCVQSTAVGANGNDFYCFIPRGLVVNQSNFVEGIEPLYNMVDAIFGEVLDPEEIIKRLKA